MPVPRGVADGMAGAPYRINPFFPRIGRDAYAEVVERIRGGVLSGRQMAQACWCAPVSPSQIAALIDEM